MNVEEVAKNLIKQIKELKTNSDSFAYSIDYKMDNRMDEKLKETTILGSSGSDDTAVKSMKLEVDFLQGKKKRSRKKNIAHILSNDNSIEVNTRISSFDADSDYTYEELLRNVFELYFEQNPDMRAGRKLKLNISLPQLLRVGTKKTAFVNFMDIAKTLHRPHNHLLRYLLAELGTSGSIDGNQQLVIKGRFECKQIESVLRRYIKEYVMCPTCRSTETLLQKDKRLYFIQCEMCGCRYSVADIKSGFRAITRKRTAIRDKTK